MKSFSRSNQCQRLFLRSQRSDIEEISKLAHGYSVDVAQNHETSYRETAAAILVNWDCPVWKCGNLVSTGDVLSIPEPTHRPCGPLFRVSRSNQVLSSHSNVPQCRDHTPLFPLESNGSPSCTRSMYLPPSLLLIPLSLFLPPLYLSRCADTVTNFWRKRPGAIRLRGLSTSKEPLHLCHVVPYLLSQSEPSNSCTARYLQFQWNLSTRVEHPSHRGFATWPKFTSLFPRINIGQRLRESYPFRANEIFGLITLFELFPFVREALPRRFEVFCLLKWDVLCKAFLRIRSNWNLPFELCIVECV